MKKLFYTLLTAVLLSSILLTNCVSSDSMRRKTLIKELETCNNLEGSAQKKCFKKIADNFKNVQNFTMAGEYYTKAGEKKLAQEAYTVAAQSILKHPFEKNLSYYISTAAFINKRMLLAAGFSNGKIQIINIKDGKTISTINAHNNKIKIITASSDGKYIATASVGSRVKIFDSESGKKIHEFSLRARSVSSIAISSNNELIAIAGSSGKIKIYGFPDGDHQRTIRTSDYKIKKIVFIDNNKKIISGGKKIAVWNIKNGYSVKKIASYFNATHLAVSPGEKLVSAVNRNKLMIWSIQTGETLLKKHRNSSKKGLSFISDNSHVVTAQENGYLYAYATPSFNQNNRAFSQRVNKNINGMVLHKDLDILVTYSGYTLQTMYFNNNKIQNKYSLCYELFQKSGKSVQQAANIIGKTALASGNSKTALKYYKIAGNTDNLSKIAQSIKNDGELLQAAAIFAEVGMKTEAFKTLEEFLKKLMQRIIMTHTSIILL